LVSQTGQRWPQLPRSLARIGGFLASAAPIWLTKNLPLDTIRKESRRWSSRRAILHQAAERPKIRRAPFAGDLAEEEKGHEKLASNYRRNPQADVRAEKTGRGGACSSCNMSAGPRRLMTARVDTGPVIRAAFATHQNGTDIPRRLAASIGRGLSMGFAEALSDDGSLTGADRHGCAARRAALMTRSRPRPHHALSVPDSWPNRSGSDRIGASWCLRIVGRSPSSAPIHDTRSWQAAYQIVLAASSCSASAY